MKNYSEISARYMKQNNKRTIMTIFGIMMATILVFAVSTFLLSFKDSTIAEERSNGRDYEFMFYDLNNNQINKIINNIEVKNASINKSCEYKINNRRCSIIAGDSDYFKRLYGKKIISGRIPNKYGEIVIDDYTKKFLKADIGEEVQGVNTEGKTDTFKIVGISKSKYYIGTSIITFFDSSKLSKTEKYTVSVNLRSNKNKQSIIKKIAKNADIKITKDNFSSNSMILYLTGNGGNENRANSIKYIAIFVLAIIVICTIIVIYNSFNMSVIERIRYLGILKAIGATPSQIKKIIFKEGIIMGLIAFPLGCSLGFICLKYGIKFFIGDNIAGLTKFTVGFYPMAIVISAIVVAGTIFLSIILPANKAKRISAVEAMNNSNEIKKGKLRNRKSRIIRKIFGIEGDIAYKNIKRTPLRFVITVLALTVSIVIFNVFYGFIDFAKQMVKDQYGNVQYDAQIDAGTNFDESSLNDFKNQSFLNNMSVFRESCVSSVIDNKDINKKAENRYKFEHDFDKQKSNITTKLVATDNKSLNMLKDYIISGKIDEKELNRGQVILVSGQQIRNSKGQLETVLPTNYSVGDKIKIPRVKISDDKTGKEYFEEYNKAAKEAVKNNQYYELTITAIADRDPFSGLSTTNEIQIFMNDKNYREIDSNMKISRIGFKFNNDSDRNKALEFFNKDNNIGAFNYIDEQVMIDQIKNTYSQISFFVYCFIIIVSIISVVNIINTISTNLLIRKKEFSTMKAIGMTQGQLNKSVILEGTIYGIISSIIGGILSIILLMFLIQLGGGMGEVKYRFAVIPFILSIIVTILITYLSTLAPLKKLKNLTIVEGIRDED